MILYQLRCSGDHEFEAWFRDSAGYDEQIEAGAIACPVCGDASVSKAVMAPRIAKGGGKEEESRAETPGAPEKAGTYSNIDAVGLRQALTELRQHIEANSDYVGDTFPEEARKIHYGETDKRNIHGEATEKEARELSEEGIEVGRIPWLPRTDS